MQKHPDPIGCAILGEDFFNEAKSVAFVRTPGAKDDDLANLKELSALQSVAFLGTHKVTDAGLANLKQLRYLQTLYLVGTKVTDAGVDDFHRALPNCQIIQ